MGVVQNVIGLVRDINERKKNAQINEELKNYLTNPELAVAMVNEIDAPTAIGLDRQRRADSQSAEAQAAARRKSQLEGFTQFTGMLRAAPEGADYRSLVKGMAPTLKGLFGVDDNTVSQWGETIASNPSIITSLDEEANKARAKADFGDTVVGPGSAYVRGGKKQFTQPFAPQVRVVPDGKGGNSLVGVDPNAIVNGDVGTAPDAQPQPGAGAGAPMNVEALRPHFVQQESSGNYTAKNDKTGALGAYQVMPATGAALAKRLGLAWRPDMMTRDDPASKRYQDAIGGAAIKEAVDASGGDPATAFMYYHGGSDRGKWGPNTRQYAADMQARMGGQSTPSAQAGPAGPGVRVLQSNPGAGVRPATPAEIEAAGYPAGTAAQIKPDGTFTNLRTPPVSAQAKPISPDKKRLYVKQAQTAISGLERLENMANEILKDPNLPGIAGTVQGRLPGWALGQKGQNTINKLENLKNSQVALQAINSLKQLSTSGATGFGNMSNAEGERIAGMLGTLDRTSDENVIRETLRGIISFAREQKANAQAGLSELGQGGGGGRPVGTVIRNPQTGEERTWNGRGWVVSKKGNR